MQRIRSCAVIVSDFPDDAVETEGGEDFVLWPGRNIAEAFCEILRGLGYEATSPEHQQEHGWTFEATTGDGYEIWFQITVIEDCLLVTKNLGRKTSFLDSLFGPKRRDVGAYTDLLAKFGAVLQADPRFKSARWSTLEDIRI